MRWWKAGKASQRHLVCFKLSYNFIHFDKVTNSYQTRLSQVKSDGLSMSPVPFNHSATSPSEIDSAACGTLTVMISEPDHHAVRQQRWLLGKVGAVIYLDDW
jgi:hypothetical protein